MFQGYQPCCVRCHVYTVQPCWPKRLRLLPGGRFLPAQLILFDVHLESRHAEPRGSKLCTGGRMDAQGCAGGQRSLSGTRRGQMPTAHAVWFDASGCEGLKTVGA